MCLIWHDIGLVIAINCHSHIETLRGGKNLRPVRATFFYALDRNPATTTRVITILYRDSLGLHRLPCLFYRSSPLRGEEVEMSARRILFPFLSWRKSANLRVSHPCPLVFLGGGGGAKRGRKGERDTTLYHTDTLSAFYP